MMELRETLDTLIEEHGWADLLRELIELAETEASEATDDATIEAWDSVAAHTEMAVDEVPDEDEDEDDG